MNKKRGKLLVFILFMNGVAVAGWMGGFSINLLVVSVNSLLLLLFLPATEVFSLKKYPQISLGFSLFYLTFLLNVIESVPGIDIWESSLIYKVAHILSMYLLLHGALKLLYSTKQADKEIHYTVYHDKFTGLINKEGLERRFELYAKATENSPAAAFLKIDIDRLKAINDFYGFETGDLVIKKMGEVLSSYFYKTTTHISRYSGDEFLLMLEGYSDIQEVIDIAEDLKSFFHREEVSLNVKLQPTCSIGISLFPLNGETFAELHRNADLALMMGKENGGDKISVYCSEAEARYMRERQIESSIKNAIENDELEIYFQPQINAADKKVMGLEALLRWNNPQLGFVSPGEFIPLVEKTGDIIEIGEWVLKTAMEKALKWIERDKEISIGINVSTRQFMHPLFIETLEGLIKNAKFPTENLVLEITETLAMIDIDTVVERLTKIRTMGIKIAIDDFGKGYSSFGYLKRLPIQYIKIDKEFIDGIEKSQKDREIVAGIIELIRKLNLIAIAEGVETEVQYDILNQQKCHKIQGYYISRPLTEGQINTLLHVENKEFATV